MDISVNYMVGSKVKIAHLLPIESKNLKKSCNDLDSEFIEGFLRKSLTDIIESRGEYTRDQFAILNDDLDSVRNQLLSCCEEARKTITINYCPMCGKKL